MNSHAAGYSRNEVNEGMDGWSVYGLSLTGLVMHSRMFFFF